MENSTYYITGRANIIIFNGTVTPGITLFERVERDLSKEHKDVLDYDKALQILSEKIGEFTKKLDKISKEKLEVCVEWYDILLKLL